MIVECHQCNECTFTFFINTWQMCGPMMALLQHYIYVGDHDMDTAVNEQPIPDPYLRREHILVEEEELKNSSERFFGN